MNLQKESNPRQVVPVAAGLLMQDGNASADTAGQGIDISFKGISIHVTQITSMELLSDVMKVISNAK